MYEIIKSVIAAGGYKLAEIQHKIKKLYILGDLTEEEMDVLLAMTQQNATASAERPETLALIRNLADRVAAVEKALAANKDTSEGDAEAEEYEAWAAWDGISNKYQPGAIVSHNGQLWQSVYSGQNVWEPGTVGTESLWVIYTPENKEVNENV